MRRTAYEIVRDADIAHAASLASHGLVEMARELLRRYPGEELPQCVAEVRVSVPRVLTPVRRASPAVAPARAGAPTARRR